MKHAFALGALFTALFSTVPSKASWLSMDRQKALCEESNIVFVGSLKSIKVKDYISVGFPFTKELNVFVQDLARFSVRKILRNRPGVSSHTEDVLLAKGLSAQVDGRCEGPHCHMRLPKKIGDEGIWLITDRHPNTGSFMLLHHPENPLPHKDLAEVEKILRNCR